jgi:tRNA A-37 threonylcarbamoyl transferase component Bud32
MSDSPSMVDIFKERYEARYNEVVQSVRVIQQWTRSYSEVFLLEFVTDQQTRRIIGKRIVHHVSNEIYSDRGNPAQIEFDAIKSLDGGFAQIENCGVPTPRMIDADEQCYFMDFVEGEELESLMKHLRFFAPRTSLMQLGQVFFQAGRWLKHFQELTGVEYSDARSLESVVRHCDHRLKLIGNANDYRIPKYFRERVLEQVEFLIPNVTRSIPVSGCHGDFGPWNIITRGNELTVIDFYAFRREFIAVDATNVLVNLENQRAAPSFSRRRIDLLAREFLSGYSLEQQLDPAALEIAEIFYRVCSIHGCVSLDGENLRERLRARRVLRRNIGWLAEPTHRQLIWDQVVVRMASLA